MAFDRFGWKRSLFGEMAVHGMEGVRFYIPSQDVDRPLAHRHPRRRRIRHADNAVRAAPKPSRARKDQLRSV
jgi:hypothetical protein